MQNGTNLKPKSPTKPTKPAPRSQVLGKLNTGKFVSEKYKNDIVRIVDMNQPGRVEYLQSIGYNFCTEGKYISSVKELNAETVFGQDTVEKDRVVWSTGKNGARGVFMFISKEKDAERQEDMLYEAAKKERTPDTENFN